MPASIPKSGERVMGILDTLGEVVGAVAAVEAAEKLDPNAGLLTKGVAAIAGFKGAGALESTLAKKEGDADTNEAESQEPDSQA
ncbi:MULTISPECIES: hypothetical protein [Dyella]|nr:MULTISPECIES: hypothetical protein [Dyella]